MSAPRTVAILQSNYVPWKGYFDMIRRADAFVLYDEVQYTRSDWRNRNRIKTAGGTRWLTIPMAVRFRDHEAVREARIADAGWARRHWSILQQADSGAPHYRHAAGLLAPLYAGASSPYLSVINRAFIEALCRALEIATPLHWSWDLPGGEGDQTGRLVAICQALGAARYLSGPAAEGYLDVARFTAAGIAVEWMRYDGYPSYPQLHGGFVHQVSAIDLLFCTGPEAPRYARPEGSA